VKPDVPKNPAQIHDSFAIQVQFIDRRSSRRRESAEMQVIHRPHEVLVPAIPARVKESRHGACQWISTLDRYEFVIIALLARQGVIGNIVSAA
jgi:hypothetical protein